MTSDAPPPRPSLSPRLSRRPPGTRPRMVLSANAVLGQGGQGLNLEHMRQAFENHFDLQIFSRGPAHPGTHSVPQSALSQLLCKLPLLRRRRDWIALSSDLQFDTYTAEHLGECEIFQGVVGQSAESLKAARRHGAILVLDCVNTHLDDFQPRIERETRKFGQRSFISPAMAQRIREEYHAAQLIRVMTDRARSTFLERGYPETQIITATPPIPVETFPQATFSHNKFRISFVGLIEPWKGFHYLLEAYEKAALKDAELVFWGGPGSRAASQLLNEYQSRCAGIQVRPEAVRAAGYSEVYGKTSVLVHPSVADGFAYAVAEAMASGVPVIVTDNTGAADFVEDGVNGYIVPVGDVAAIAERLRHLAAHPELLPQLGQRARERMQQLTLANFRKPMLDMLQRLL